MDIEGKIDALAKQVQALVESVMRLERMVNTGRLLTVTEAAIELQDDVAGLKLNRAQSTVTRAANEGKFISRRHNRDRRIDPLTFARWRCDR